MYNSMMLLNEFPDTLVFNFSLKIIHFRKIHISTFIILNTINLDTGPTTHDRLYNH